MNANQTVARQTAEEYIQGRITETGKITSSGDYFVTVGSDNAITVYRGTSVNESNKVAEGTLLSGGKVEWESSGSGSGGTTPTIPEGLEVGSDVTYTPSGTYTEWTTDHSGSSSYNYSLASGSSYTGATGQTDMTITNWKVFKIDGSTVQLVPDGTKVTTPTVGLYGATGYNNAVKLLNDACSSLYGNSSKNIIARSINMEDIESVLNYDPTTYTGTVQYGQQYSSAYTSSKTYPNIYAEEIDSVITPEPTGKTKTLGRNDAASNWISGSTPAGTSIQPYQTYYKLDYSDFSSKLETAGNGTAYSSILLPNTSSTNYWVASRCVYLSSSRCHFIVRDVASGALDVYRMFDSDSGTNHYARPVFPVVSLSFELLEGDATAGFSVK